MSQRNVTIDAVYQALVQAPPIELHPTVPEVLAAVGMFASAIFKQSYSDPAARRDEVNRFCQLLWFCANRSHDATTRPTLN